MNQTLGQQRLNEKLWQRSLRLLSKICKARNVIPASYILQPELIRVGTIRSRGGFADVSDGDYNGLPAAVKRLRVNREDSDRAFKVPLIDLAHHHCSLYAVVVPGDHHLETSVPPQRPTFAGGLRRSGPTWFQRSDRVDAQREYCTVCKV